MGSKNASTVLRSPKLERKLMKSKILARIRNVNSAVDSFIDFFSDVEKNEIFFIKMKLGRRNERPQIFSHEKNNFCHFFTLALNEFHGLAHHGLVLRVSVSLTIWLYNFPNAFFPTCKRVPLILKQAIKRMQKYS